MVQERADLKVEGNALLDQEERSEEEQARLDEITGRVAELNAAIEKEEGQREAMRQAAAPTVLKMGRGDSEMRAMANYLRTGDASGLAYQAAYNNTDMNIGTAADGGYAVPTGMYNQIIARRDELALFTRLGVRAIPGQGLTVNVPIDDEADLLFTSVAEAGNIGQDAPALNQKAFTLAKYAKYVTLSWELLRDEDANLLSFVNDWIGRGIAATENSLLLTEARAGGTAGLTLDGASTIGSTEIPEFVGKLAPEYQDGAWWVLNPATVALIQGLSGTSNWYFAPIPANYAGWPTLWGFPVAQSGQASAIAASAKSLIFGNFQFMGRRQGTTIQMLRDPYTAAGTGQIKLWFWFDCVYGVLQAEAIQFATHPTA
jgi:HK97 family phage major capsid protein